MKCIVGLGNPGRKYAKTRHNIGFLVLDELAERMSSKLPKNKFKCDYDIVHLAGEKVMLVEPQTFMNLSGEGVRPLIDYYDIPIEDVAVVFDDLDLPAGRIRLREKGGHGGHNGIRSLITHLGTKEFKRIRIGIGRPETPMTVVDYVLQKFSKAEKPLIQEAIQQGADAAEVFIQQDFNHAMNQANQK